MLYSALVLIAVRMFARRLNRMSVFPTRELDIDNGLLREIDDMKKYNFNLNPVKKLHIRGVPYSSGATFYGQERLKEFFEGLRYSYA